MDITDYNNPDSLKFISVSDIFLVFGIKAKDTILYISLKDTTYNSNPLTRTIIYSISNPLFPESLSFIPEGSSDLYIIDTLLYIPSFDSLFIYNVKNPENPVLLSKYDYTDPYSSYGLYELNTYLDTINKVLYITTISKLYSYDISNPLSISIMDTISVIKYYWFSPPCPWGVWSFSKWNNYIYAVATEVEDYGSDAYCKDTVVIIDISDPYNLSKIGGFRDSCLFSSVFIIDSIFLLGKQLRTKVLTRNPLNPPLVAYYNINNNFVISDLFVTSDLYIWGFEDLYTGRNKFSTYHIYSTPTEEKNSEKEKFYVIFSSNKLIYDVGTTLFKIQITDISGRIRRDLGWIYGKGEINIKGINPGTYFLILKNKRSYVKKIQIWR